MSKQPINIRRTWRVRLYADWGDGASARVHLGSHTVALMADHEGTITSEIDGQVQATIDRTLSYLRWAKDDGTLTLIGDEPLPPPAPAPLTLEEPIIGKARASVLHKLMGLTGLPHAQHYALSAAALGEPWPLSSLATLTEREARTVWAHLCRVYPAARQAPERLHAARPPAA